MKSSAIAYSNIAFVKYWGRNENLPRKLNLPLNDSVSMTIRLQAHTTIEFSDNYDKDTAILEGRVLEGRQLERVLAVVNPLREKAGVEYKFKMVSRNGFPTKAGLASSAAGFAALALASAHALKLKLSKEELSTYARLGSGSAARSIHGGFVYWHKGSSHETSYAEQICNPKDFEISAVIAIINRGEKEVGSDIGHESAKTSIFNEARVRKSQEQAMEIRSAILNNDFTRAGEIIEKNCKYMHAVMMTSKPGLFYWEPATLRVIKAVQEARMKGLECYFTIDAGPNVHCLCRVGDRGEVKKMLEKIKGVKKAVPVKLAGNSYITEKHLL